MGEVWAAVNESTGGEFALKFLVHESDELRRRLLHEARACGRLRHHNIVAVLDVGELDGGKPFLVMQLLTGETLAELLAKTRRLPSARAVSIARDVCRALATAHEAGIVHRDLKPANIFLHKEAGTEDVVVKVLDFGVSKNLHLSDAQLTIAGSRIGSPAYMSPEQTRCDPSLDHRTDLWSLGVVLFEMLTGKRPFAGESHQLLVRIATEPIPRVSDLVRNTHPEIDDIVARCLEPDVDRRLGSAEEIGARLEQIVLGGVLPRPPLLPFGTSTIRGPERARPAAVMATPEPTYSAPRAAPEDDTEVTRKIQLWPSEGPVVAQPNASPSPYAMAPKPPAIPTAAGHSGTPTPFRIFAPVLPLAAPSPPSPAPARRSPPAFPTLVSPSSPRALPDFDPQVRTAQPTTSSKPHRVEYALLVAMTVLSLGAVACGWALWSHLYRLRMLPAVGAPVPDSMSSTRNPTLNAGEAPAAVALEAWLDAGIVATEAMTSLPQGVSSTRPPSSDGPPAAASPGPKPSSSPHVSTSQKPVRPVETPRPNGEKENHTTRVPAWLLGQVKSRPR